jgi:hypothetical protein
MPFPMLLVLLVLLLLLLMTLQKPCRLQTSKQAEDTPRAVLGILHFCALLQQLSAPR